MCEARKYGLSLMCRAHSNTPNLISEDGSKNKSDIMAIIEGYARPAPVDAQMIPISTVTTDYAVETGLSRYQTAGEVIAAFQNGDITAEEAVAKLMSKFGMSERDATNMVFKASTAGQGLDEWVEEAQAPFKEALENVGSNTVATISTPEIEDAPTDDEEETVVSRAFTQDQKYALIGLVVMGMVATYYKRR